MLLPIPPYNMIVFGFILLWLNTVNAADHLTRNVNGFRTGANDHETIISPMTLSQGLGGKQFQKIAEYAVDDMLEAQPLVKTQVMIPGKGKHDVVYAVTMNNSIYAFDAYTAETLWSRIEIDPSIWTQKGLPNPHCMDKISCRWGVSSTPVIDADTQTLYLVTWARRNNNNDDREYRIHALDLATGNDKIAINALPYFPLQGSSFNGNVLFRTGAPKPGFGELWQQKLRAGLALADAGGGRKGLVIAFSMSGEDINNPNAGHGFVFAFDTRGLLGQAGISPNPAIWTTSPNGALAGIWMAGAAPVVENSDIYFTTGNGTLGLNNGQQNYAESFVHLRFLPAAIGINNNQPTLAVQGYWTAFNDFVRTQNNGGQDQDLGSGGILAIPGTLSLIGAGKDGVVYNIDRTRLKPGVDGMRHLQFGKDDGAGQSEAANTWDALVGGSRR